MRARTRLATSLAAVLVPALLLGSWTQARRTDDTRVPTLRIPERIGPWTSVAEDALNEAALGQIRPDAYRLRAYAAPGRAPIWLYVGLYGGRGGGAKGAHDPEVCYPAQGWEILQSGPRAIVLEDFAVVHAAALRVHHQRRRQSVLYWFQPAGRWPEPPALDQLYRVFDALVGRPQYAFVRLSAGEDDAGQADADLAEFAALAAPSLRAAVEAY